MAEQQVQHVKRAFIADTLGVQTTDISELRRSLMDKGIIEAPRHGFLSFTAPGFADFILTERLLDDE